MLIVVCSISLYPMSIFYHQIIWMEHYSTLWIVHGGFSVCTVAMLIPITDQFVLNSFLLIHIYWINWCRILIYFIHYYSYINHEHRFLLRYATSFSVVFFYVPYLFRTLVISTISRHLQFFINCLFVILPLFCDLYTQDG